MILPKVLVAKKKKKRRKKVNIVEQQKTCNFENTRLGFELKALCREEYLLLDNMTKETKLQITPGLIEQISYSSSNPYFKTRAFRIALLDFKVHGYRLTNFKKTDEEIRLITIKLKERGLA